MKQMYMGRTHLVGVSIREDFQNDIRTDSTLAMWDEDEVVEVFYAPTPITRLSKDKIVQYAKYRVPNPSHILFIDQNILPRKNTLANLLKHDKDVVSAIYPVIQKGGLKWNVCRDNERECMEPEDMPRNMFKAMAVGCGAILVKYEVFENIEWPYWKNEFIEGDIKTPEDLYFCRKLRKAGYDIWVDPMTKCDNIKKISYLGMLRERK